MQSISCDLTSVIEVMGFHRDRGEKVFKFINEFGRGDESVLYPNQQGFELHAEGIGLAFKYNADINRSNEVFEISQSVEGFGNFFDCEQLIDVMSHIVKYMESELRNQKVEYRVVLEKGWCTVKFMLEPMRTVDVMTFDYMMDALLDYSEKPVQS